MALIPNQSLIHSYMAEAYFSDCFVTDIRYDEQSALTLFLSVARQTPSWVNALMSLRNCLVAKVGLKNLGTLSDIESAKIAEDYELGDKVGIFSLHTNEHSEVILEDRDKHLSVKISFYIEPNGNTAKVYTTTVVHVNNTLGKVYMFFVAPVHKIIVPSTLKALHKV